IFAADSLQMQQTGWLGRLQVVARSGPSDPYCRAVENRGKRGRGVRPGIGQNGGNQMSVMASPSGQQIDIAASVRAAYQFAGDNARLAVNLALVPFAILVGAEFLAWLIGGGGWFGMRLALLIQA